MRVVLDCNVVVSAARVDGTCREVINKAVRGHEIVLSEPILAEYQAIAGRPSQALYRETMEFVIREIERLAIVVEPADVVFGLRDPDDEVYLATAVAGGASLITGNTRDFTEPRYGPVEVWSPRDFLDRAN
ncbi:MAG: putative toxin-antitoxin system toxin component, PIN family [Rhodospirillaceae bacterium]|nr:putative toxin-antitoxin system toxin component, PIN family [Rhodospirillaceae bacterium]